MIRAIPFLCMALSPACAGDLAYITSQNADLVTLIELPSGKVLAQTPIAGAPAPVAYDPQSQRAYVIAADSGRLYVLDEAGGVIASRNPGTGSFGLAVGAKGGLFIADWFGNQLSFYDQNLMRVWRVPTGAAPTGVAASPDGKWVATADRDDDQVSIFDAQTGALRHQVRTAGPHPFGITFHDGRFWTADVMGDLVSVIDPVAGRVTGQIATGSRPYAVAFAGGRGFVTNQYDATLTVFDPASLAVLGQIEVGDYPEGIAPLPDDSGVIVANWDSDTVQIVDAATLSVTAEVEMPSGPRAFGTFTGRQITDQGSSDLP